MFKYIILPSLWILKEPQNFTSGLLAQASAREFLSLSASSAAFIPTNCTVDSSAILPRPPHPCCLPLSSHLSSLRVSRIEFSELRFPSRLLHHSFPGISALLEPLHDCGCWSFWCAHPWKLNIYQRQRAEGSFAPKTNASGAGDPFCCVTAPSHTA